MLSEREANYAKALGLYRRLLAQDTTNAYFLKQLGGLHAKLNQPTLAVQFYQKALKIAPDDLEAMGELAALYLNDGKKDKFAEVLITRGLKLDATSVKFLQLDSRLSYRLGNFKEVVQDVEKTMALGDTASYYQRLLGTAYYQVDSLKKSIRTFQRLLKSGDETEAVYAGLGTALLLKAELGTPDTSVNYQNWQLHSVSGNFSKAIEKGTSPRIPDYQFGIADEARIEGQLEWATHQYRIIYEKYQRPKALYRLGQVQEKKDPGLAAIYYREFLDVCKDPKKAAKAGTDCLLVGQVQARLQAVKKLPGAKGKPATTEPVVAKDTATAVPDTTNRDEK